MKSSFYLFLILILSSCNNMTEIEKALQIQDETKSIERRSFRIEVK